MICLSSMWLKNDRSENYKSGEGETPQRGVAVSKTLSGRFLMAHTLRMATDPQHQEEDKNPPHLAVSA
jgi:hypothetical protein